MKYPSFKEEKKLWKEGYNSVVGLDEAGRGPLAGPVVASAVIVRQFQISNLKFKIKDSKKLSVKKREKIYEILVNHSDIFWGIGVVSEKVIDKINILEATKLAMQNALNNLYDLYYKPDGRQVCSIADFLLIDGNFRINSQIPQKSIINGDEKVFSCAAAGIIAKVERDKIMYKIHQKYPLYGFNRHKGYGTKLHIENLKKFGPSKVHRRSFYPVRSLS